MNETTRKAAATAERVCHNPVERNRAMSGENASLPPFPMEEGVEFRHIEGFPGYAVGDNGMVLTCFKKRWSGFGVTWKILKQARHRQGYRLVCLKHGDTRVTRHVHRLVCAAFNGKQEPWQECCHWNSDKADNRSCNLRWDSGSANRLDRRRDASWHGGEKHNRAKLTVQAAYDIWRLNGIATRRELSERFGISRRSVLAIWRGDNWSHAIEQYIKSLEVTQ